VHFTFLKFILYQIYKIIKCVEYLSTQVFKIYRTHANTNTIA